MRSLHELGSLVLVVENPGFWKLGMGNWEILMRLALGQNYQFRTYADLPLNHHL
jgi:hypothetical protein